MDWLKIVAGIIAALFFIVLAGVVSYFRGKQDNNVLHPDPDKGFFTRTILSILRAVIMIVSLLSIPYSLTWAGVGTILFWIASTLSILIVLFLGTVICLTIQAAAASNDDILFNRDWGNRN